MSEWEMPAEHVSAIAGAFFVLRPSHVLEWGSGMSTDLLRAACREYGGDLVSIDNSKEWAEKRNTLYFPERDEYVGWPVVHVPKGGWDFVLVDGRWRSRCLRAIKRCLTPWAVVALHDAQRKHYHEAADEYQTRLTVPALDGTGRELWLLSAPKR